MLRIKTAALPLFALYWLASSAAAQAQQLEKLPYVPTPQIVVDEMLKMAGVTAKDFVVDLGEGQHTTELVLAPEDDAAHASEDEQRQQPPTGCGRPCGSSSRRGGSRPCAG